MHLRAEKLRCSQPSARADELDELVWNEVVRHLHHPELILRSCVTPAASTLTADATRQLTDLRSQQARLIDAYQAGVISLRDLEARRRPVTDRITELEQITRQAERQRTSKAELQQRIDAFASQIADGLATMDFNRRQQLVRTVIDKVIVSESRVEILFNIPLPGAPKEGRSPATRVNQLRPQRQDRAETRLPLRGLAPLLRPPHRRRTRLRHRQGPRHQRHQPRLVPPHGPTPPDAVHRHPAHRPQPAHPGSLERPAGTNPAPRGRRAPPENPQTAPQDPRRARHRATLTRNRHDHDQEPPAITTSQDSHKQARARSDTRQNQRTRPRRGPEDPGTDHGLQGGQNVRPKRENSPH
jgi:hypothetical protein